MLLSVRLARGVEAAISATSTRPSTVAMAGVAGQDGRVAVSRRFVLSSVPRTLRPASGPALDEAGVYEEEGTAPAILACDGWPLSG